jgi:dolichyl-phosphate-mannose-protein mannosyltransferase
VTTKRKKVRKNLVRSESREDSPIVDAKSADIAPESSFVPGYSTHTIVAIALILFIAAHLALMIGLTTPDKITFDEVHYVPAAKQMLEHGTSNSILSGRNRPRLYGPSWPPDLQVSYCCCLSLCPLSDPRCKPITAS